LTTWSRSTRRRKKPSTTVRPTLQKMRQWAKEAEPFSRAVAEAQYDRTQACLAEAGVDSVVVYRGVPWDIDEDTWPKWAEVAYRCAIPGLAEVPPDPEVGLVVPDQEVSLAPLSSWRTSRSMARKFADDFADARTGWDFLYGVMTARVPASAVVSTSRDGARLPDGGRGSGVGPRRARPR
jgi:hypothetical protein